MNELRKLNQYMCSIDLSDPHWHQDLPQLPVPDLWLTVSRYLASLRAILKPHASAEKPEELIGCSLSADKFRGLAEQFARTDKLVKEFMLNEGPQLQRDLKEYANKCQNWATEFWLNDMYLSNPLPLPVNSNPFFMFPRQQFQSSADMLMFATRVIQFSVDFKFRIDQQTLKQDLGSGHGRGKALCMETYKNFFHSYRMPHEDHDRLLPQSRRTNHIVVASCNQFFILRLGQDPLENPYRKDASSTLGEQIIFDQLLRIYKVSRENARRAITSPQSHNNSNQNNGNFINNNNNIPLIGLLTTENRKVWAKLHKKLTCEMRLDDDDGDDGGQKSEEARKVNAESLRSIEDCLFVMCLDSLVSTRPQLAKSARKESLYNTKENRKLEEEATVILTGGGTDLFTGNRWFDKFLQVIVGRDGVCGINIEHSASEGITVLRFLQEFLEYLDSNPCSSSSQLVSNSVKTTAPCDENNNHNSNNINYSNHIENSKHNNNIHENDKNHSISSPRYTEPQSPKFLLEESDKITPLEWRLNADTLLAIDEAENKINKLIDNFSLIIYDFNTFGRNFIKDQSLSPDAFIQLALQYTFYKLHGMLVSTYESASLRQFRLGRVDNIRANSVEAFDWIQAMLKCEQLNDKQYEGRRWASAEPLFIQAITKQVEVLRYTISGSGPDNHLLALRQLANHRYDKLPQLFLDESYKDFLNFRLSTSQLPNEVGITVGYGAVVPDGYGCAYNPRQDCIVFCISTFKDCPDTSSTKFVQQLDECLLQMRDLCLDRHKS